MKTKYLPSVFFAVFSIAMIANTWYALKDYVAYTLEIVRGQDYPTAAASMLLILSIWHAIVIWKEQKAGVEQKKIIIPTKVRWIMLLTLIFIITSMTIGYFVSTFFFSVLSVFTLLNFKKIHIALLYGTCLTAMVYALFTIMNVYFPKVLLF